MHHGLASVGVAVSDPVDESISLSRARIVDVLGVLVPLLPAVYQFFSGDRTGRIEMYIVSAFGIVCYIAWRQTQRAILGDRRRMIDLAAAQALCEVERKSERTAHEAQVGALHACLLNMHKDVIMFAGGRTMGQLAFDADKKTYLYTPAPIPVPPTTTGERRRAPAKRKKS